MVSSRASRLRHAAPWLVLGVAALLVVVLGTQRRTLQREVRRLQGRQHLLQAGDVVPMVLAPVIGGDSVTLGGGPARVQILFVLTTTCPYCIETLPRWKQIADRVRPMPEIALIGVSLDGDSATAAYAAAHALPFPIVRFPTSRAAGTYRAVGSPITLALDSGGTVLYVRAGVLTPAAVDSLFRTLESTLSAPGGGGSS